MTKTMKKSKLSRNVVLVVVGIIIIVVMALFLYTKDYYRSEIAVEDYTKENTYNIEEFEYQRNFPDEYLGHCISKFMLHFVSCTMAAGITPPKDAKYFSVHFSEYSYLKHLMPPLDKKEDGISYFIWQESK